MTSGPFRITDKQFDTIDEWFKSKGVHPRCSQCGQDKFSAIDHLFAPVPWGPGGLFLAGSIVPTLGLVCRNCGSIQMFAAAMMGLLNDVPAQPDAPSAPERES